MLRDVSPANLHCDAVRSLRTGTKLRKVAAPVGPSFVGGDDDKGGR